MKKTVLAVALICVLVLASCANQAPNSSTPPSSQETNIIGTVPTVPTKPTQPTVTSTPTQPTDPTQETQPNLEYVPGSVIIDPDWDGNSGTPARKHRNVYYRIHGFFLNLIPDGKWGEVTDRLNAIPKDADGDSTQMAYLVFIQVMDLPREEFEKAVDRQRQLWISQGDIEEGQEVVHECYELPNADVLYTFDNDLINYYYRLE